jgi:para-nitrobenzyl esterase
MFECQEEVMQRRRGAGEQWFTNMSPLPRQRLVD